MQSPMDAVAQAVLGSSGPAPSPESLEVELVEVDPAQQAGQPQQVSTLGAYCCYILFLIGLQTMHVVLLVAAEANPLALLQLSAAFSLGLLVLVTLLRNSLTPTLLCRGGPLSCACRAAAQQPRQRFRRPRSCVAAVEWPQQVVRIGKSAPLPCAAQMVQSP